MHITLSDLTEKLSEEIGTTFTAIVDTAVVAKLGFKISDFDDVEKIVKRFIPEAKLDFVKANYFNPKEYGAYDVYIINLKEPKDERKGNDVT